MNHKLSFKKVFLWFLVLSWMSVIFYFSHMNTTESNKKSLSAVEQIIDTTDKLDNNKQDEQSNTDLTLEEQYQKQQYEKYQRKQLIHYLNYPIRKLAHMFIYFVLACITFIALKNTTKIKKLGITTIIICFIYACTDEFHQMFISGRTGNFLDVIIDVVGASIYILMYKNYKRNHNKK